MTKLGVQVHPRNAAPGRPSPGWSAAEKARLELFYERTNGAPLMFLEDFDMAKAAKRKYPNRRIVFREGARNEQIPDYRGNGRQLYESLVRFTELGIIVNVWNEPDTYNRQERIAERVTEIGVEFLNEAVRRGNAQQFIIGNFGTGHPWENTYGILKPFFRAVIDSDATLGLHEYGTYRGMQWIDPAGRTSVVPFRVGRFQWILDYCAKEFGRVPWLSFTEFGRDHSMYEGDDPTKRGYRDSIAPDPYAHELIACYRAKYHGIAKVRDLFTYSMGNGGTPGKAEDWTSHNVFDEAWMAVIEKWYAELTSTLPPPPVPEPPPGDGDTQPNDPRLPILNNIQNHMSLAAQHLEAVVTLIERLK